MLNNKVAKKLFMSNNLFLVVVIQINTKKYLINWYLIYKIARKKFDNIYIFLLSHIRSKIRSKNLVFGKKLFQVQDKNIVIWPELLYYTKNMPTTMFSNIYTSISLVNEARY